MSDDDMTDAEWGAELLALAAEHRTADAALLWQAWAEQPEVGWVTGKHDATAQRWPHDVAPIGELCCDVPSPGGAIRLWATRPRWVKAGAAVPWVVRVITEPPSPEHRAATLPEATAAALAAERARREALARAWLGGAP